MIRVGGLVQIPCIERNVIASIKVINAARLALKGDGTHKVSLDEAIRTTRDTGPGHEEKCKEAARGGLAVNRQYPRGVVGGKTDLTDLQGSHRSRSRLRREMDRRLR